jgi:hypothetical protein
VKRDTGLAEQANLSLPLLRGKCAPMQRQIIASRVFTVTDLGLATVEIFFPMPVGTDVMCEYKITWPDKTKEGHAMGVDGIQAIANVLKRIGAEINFSSYAKNGKLVWLDVGRGFGLPLAKGLEQFYSGDDPP